MTEKMIPESLIRSIVQDEIGKTLGSLAGLLGAAPTPPKHQEWYPTVEAWKLLDLKNDKQLREMRRNGIFTQGTHYRRSNRSLNAARPTWDWHIERCKQALANRHRQRV